MQFTPQLEEKFRKLAQHYPVRRSALIPMLLFAQDEYGYLSKEIIAEISRRIELTVLDVEGTISYYSMLRQKPAGKFHLQICTNISCMLRGGDAIFEHAKKKLGIAPGEITSDGLFSLEEVECIGACAWAPAMQVNYDFHHELTPERFDQLIQEIQKVRKQ
jgi:NADH-quinone oxidoreductase subunit E